MELTDRLPEAVQQWRELEDWEIPAVGGILLVAAVLRLFRLGSRPFWADEAVYTLAAREMLEKGYLVAHYPASDAIITGHPPLSFYVLGAVQQLGSSEWLMRFPSAIYGIATVAAIYLLAREIYGRKEAVVAALFLAVSPVHVIFSREVHPTVLALLFLTAAAYFIFTMVTDTSLRNIGGFLISSILAVLSGFLSVSIAGLMAPVYLIHRNDVDVRRYGKYLLLIILVLGASSLVWTLQNSVPPKTDNPFAGASVGLSDPVSAAGLIVDFGRYIVEIGAGIPLQEYVSFWKESLWFYFGPITGFLAIPLFLAPLVSLLWRRERKDEHGPTISLYVWFGAVFVLLDIVVFAAYYEQGLSPLRGHPFFLIPVVLLTARGTVALWQSRWRLLRIIPVIFVLVSFTHVLPVAADTPVYFNYDPFNGNAWVSHGEANSSLRVNIGFDVPGSGLRIDAETVSGESFRLETIVCGDKPTGALFVCYPNHPVGYTDSIDWREATEFTLSRSEAGAKYYVSVAPPFLYYADTDDLDVTGLQCNVGHRFCNVLETVESAERPVWILADAERYGWQLNEQERNYVEDNCDRWERGNVNIFRCT